MPENYFNERFQSTILKFINMTASVGIYTDDRCTHCHRAADILNLFATQQFNEKMKKILLVTIVAVCLISQFRVRRLTVRVIWNSVILLYRSLRKHRRDITMHETTLRLPTDKNCQKIDWDVRPVCPYRCLTSLPSWIMQPHWLPVLWIWITWRKGWEIWGQRNRTASAKNVEKCWRIWWKINMEINCTFIQGLCVAHWFPVFVVVRQTVYETKLIFKFKRFTHLCISDYGDPECFRWTWHGQGTP